MFEYVNAVIKLFRKSNFRVTRTDVSPKNLTLICSTNTRYDTLLRQWYDRNKVWCILELF